jgi:hypothetical protein
MAAALHLATAQVQSLGERLLARALGQRDAADQAGAQARHLAFVGARVQLEDQFGDDQIEQAVAEELQPLVVRLAGTAMGERLPQQARVVERVAQGDRRLNSRPRG